MTALLGSRSFENVRTYGVERIKLSKNTNLECEVSTTENARRVSYLNAEFWEVFRDVSLPVRALPLPSPRKITLRCPSYLKVFFPFETLHFVLNKEQHRKQFNTNDHWCDSEKLWNTSRRVSNYFLKRLEQRGSSKTEFEIWISLPFWFANIDNICSVSTFLNDRDTKLTRLQNK